MTTCPSCGSSDICTLTIYDSTKLDNYCRACHHMFTTEANMPDITGEPAIIAERRTFYDIGSPEPHHLDIVVLHERPAEHIELTLEVAPPEENKP